MTVRGILLAAGAASALSGCSDGVMQGATDVAATVGRFIPTLSDAAQPVQPALSAPDFSVDAIAADPGAYRLVQLSSFEETIFARRIAGSDGRETLQAQNGFTYAYRDGLLTATRGIGDDLMAASVAETAAALRAGGGNYSRTFEQLGGLDQILTSTYSCTLADQGMDVVRIGLNEQSARKFSETCVGSEVQFENLYWLDNAGQIISSRQFVTPTVAYLRTSRI